MKKYNLYDLSVSDNLLNRTLFWWFIVLINAIPGFILSWMNDATLLWKLGWILTWLIIYIFIIWNNFRKIKNEIFKKSMYAAYILKTLLVIFFIWFYLDLFFWVLSTWLSNHIMDLLWFEIMYHMDTFNALDAKTNYPNIHTYITTLVHWWILSFTTLILWSIFYWVNLLISKLK
jgi:hypothetical protein